MNFTGNAFDYDAAQIKYNPIRSTDPAIAGFVTAALGNSVTILNVGAGTGSYEPLNRMVIAVEPSATMRQQRLSASKSPAINASAELLPFDDNSFDAAMAIITIHHWENLKKGISEMRRVTKGPVVILTFDPDALHLGWLASCFPELVAVEAKRYPPLNSIVEALGCNCSIQKIPVTLDCIDGFQEAFYGRPEAFLEKEVRDAQSAWGFLDEKIKSQMLGRFEQMLKSGDWDARFGEYRKLPSFHGALRLLVANRD